MKLRSKVAALLGTVGLVAGILATAAPVAASTQHNWTGNGWPNDTCSSDSQSMHWVFTAKGVSNVEFFWPTGNSAAMTEHANGSWYADVDYFDPTGLNDGSVYVTYDGTALHHAVLTLSHCDGESTSETSDLTSEVHRFATDDGGAIVLDAQNPAYEGDQVHDSATLTFTGGGDLPDGSSVTFYFWHNGTCDGAPADTSDPFDVSGDSSPSVVDPGLVETVDTAGDYSFQAVFESGDTAVVDSADGDCEPFSVLTSTGEPATDVPSEPNTATVGGNGTSSPSDSSWLLVAAIGVLLASVVVMTPARAKSRR